MRKLHADLECNHTKCNRAASFIFHWNHCQIVQIVRAGVDRTTGSSQLEHEPVTITPHYASTAVIQSAAQHDGTSSNPAKSAAQARAGCALGFQTACCSCGQAATSYQSYRPTEDHIQQQQAFAPCAVEHREGLCPALGSTAAAATGC
jgi:hypothetical protein